MTYAEKIVNICNYLTEEEQREIYNFAECVSMKKEKNIDEVVNQSINKNIEALKELAK
ncbi:MAG: hypothetical protein ACRDDY_04730 [Clostridium sp.]|uniref:hypothetical protein n=1 Tax=Clostridium sp. TaxID=1506 RepID=UPI003EE7BEE9